MFTGMDDYINSDDNDDDLLHRLRELYRRDVYQAAAPGAWVSRAMCAGRGGADEDWISTVRPVSDDLSEVYCSVCPVRDECLAYAEANQTWVTGTWGGQLFSAGRTVSVHARPGRPRKVVE